VQYILPIRNQKDCHSSWSIEAKRFVTLYAEVLVACRKVLSGGDDEVTTEGISIANNLVHISHFVLK
jgi:hypothetical protein